jgi:hypothetical protein
LHEIEHEIDVCGRNGLHENLESREQMLEDVTENGGARTRGECDAYDQHFRPVCLHQTLDRVSEYVQEHVDKVVLHAAAVEEDRHEDEHARQADESCRSAADGVACAVYTRELNLTGEVQCNYAEHYNLAPRNYAAGYFFVHGALEQMQEYDQEQAAQKQDVRVVGGDDFIRSTRQSEAHGGFESCRDLHAREHVDFAPFFYQKSKINPFPHVTTNWKLVTIKQKMT